MKVVMRVGYPARGGKTLGIRIQNSWYSPEEAGTT